MQFNAKIINIKSILACVDYSAVLSSMWFGHASAGGLGFCGSKCFFFAGFFVCCSFADARMKDDGEI